jgi:hypothetical protein
VRRCQAPAPGPELPVDGVPLEGASGTAVLGSSDPGPPNAGKPERGSRPASLPHAVPKKAKNTRAGAIRCIGARSSSPHPRESSALAAMDVTLGAPLSKIAGWL